MCNYTYNCKYKYRYIYKYKYQRRYGWRYKYRCSKNNINNNVSKGRSTASHGTRFPFSCQAGFDITISSRPAPLRGRRI